MGIKRLIKKNVMGGGNLLTGHILDAIEKKKETGKPFRECLMESVKGTITEDMPGISHVYQMGKADGREQCSVEQAKLYEEKMNRMEVMHERDRELWKEIDKEKDEIINELGKNM